MRKRILQLLAVTLFLLLVPTTAFAAQGHDPSSPNPPQPPQPPADLDRYLPDAKTLEEARQQKLAVLPITEEQHNRWEQALEKQMMALRKQLPADKLATMDAESLAPYIDLKALQEAAGISDLDSFEAPIGARSHVDLGKARHGDFLLGHNGWRPWGYWNHAGIWDNGVTYWKTIHARGYGWGVRRDAWNYFLRHYSTVAVMGVWTSTTMRYYAVWYARAQLGEPYSIWTSKTNQSKWYCSKLVWASYYWWSGRRINMDPNGGYWVTPNDLWYSGWTYLRAYG